MAARIAVGNLGAAIRAATALALLLCAGSASAAPSTDWRDYAALGRSELSIGPNIELVGNFGVVNAGGAMSVGVRTTLRGPDIFNDDSFVASDRLLLSQLSSVNDVYTNALTARPGAVIRGTQSSVTLPLLVLPPLPPGVDDPCTASAQDVLVAANATTQLSPGCYRDLRILAGGRLELQPGTYQFLRWRLEELTEVVGLAGQVVVEINDTIRVQAESSIAPSSGTPSDLQIFAGGRIVTIGRFSTVTAQVFAPDANVSFIRGVSFSGALVGDDIRIAGEHAIRVTPTPFVPTPTPTVGPPVTPTPTPSPTPSPSPSPTPTATPTPSPTPTPTPTVVPPPTPTPTFPPCPEDPTHPPTLVVSPTFSGGNVFTTLQAAVNAASDGDVIGVFSSTVENVVIDRDVEIVIRQCTVAKVTAADSTKPVLTVKGDTPALIVGLDTFGGTIGWSIDGSGHELRGVRASGASQYGLQILGSGHNVNMNRVEGNGVAGMLLGGTDNVADGGTLSDNALGVLVNGTGNTLDGITADGNSGDGVRAEGSGHTLRDLRILDNGGNGITLAGNGIDLLSSQGEGNGGDGVEVSGQNNLVRDNKFADDGGCEFDVTGSGTTDGGGSNTANNVRFNNIEAGGCFE